MIKLLVSPVLVGHLSPDLTALLGPMIERCRSPEQARGQKELTDSIVPYKERGREAGRRMAMCSDSRCASVAPRFITAA